MSNRHARSTSLADRVLRLALPSRKAEAVAGDLEEELDGSGLRVLYHSVMYAAAALWLRRRALRLFPVIKMNLRLTLRDAARSLRRSPALFVLAIAVLGTGMGAATLTFTVVDTVVLRPLAFDQPSQLISISGTTTRNGASAMVSPVDYAGWRDHVKALESIAAWRLDSARLTGGDTPLTVRGAKVTPDLFAVLRARPLIGRTLGEQDRRAGPGSVVVISHGLWQRRFGGSMDVLGAAFPAAGPPLEIVGVMPEAFAFPLDSPERADYWMPYVPAEAELSLAQGRVSFLQIVGRLRDGATVDQARAEIEAVTGGLKREHPQLYSDWRPVVEGLHESLTARVRGWMVLALWAVALLMAVACANVANLLLVRAYGRSRDSAVRASLGATRNQLVGAQLVESVLIAVVAAVVGMGLAQAGLRTLIASLPEGIVRADGIALDLRVFAVSAAAALLAGVLAGVVPAWQSSRTDVVEALKDGGGATAGPSRRRWRSALLVTEVAFVVALLVVSSLLVGSFMRVSRADLGFDHARLVAFRGFDDTAVDRLRAVPGVASVSVIGGSPPLHPGTTTTNLGRLNRAERARAELGSVSEGYFTTIGARLLAGREVTALDVKGGEPVIVIDELAARALFDDVHGAVGQKVTLPSAGEYRVVGVIANLRLMGPEAITGPQAYRALAQGPGAQPRIVVRTQGDPAAVAPALKVAMAAGWTGRGAAPAPSVLSDRLRVLTADRRFAAGLMLALGALAIVLGAIGIYSVTASIIAQRSREIGVRMALGATARNVGASVLRTTGRHLLAGALAGAAGGWMISRIFRGLLFGLTTTSPEPYLIAVGVVLAVGLIAALVPARRASRVDPLVVLKTG